MTTIEYQLHEETNTKLLRQELEAELKSLQKKDKVEEESAEYFFDRICQYISSGLTTAGDEKEVIQYFSTELEKIFSIVLAEISMSTGDQGNFEAVLDAAPLVTSDHKYADAQYPNRAMYLVSINRIYIPKEILHNFSQFGALLMELLVNGFVSTASLLHHEYIHSLHYSKLTRLQRLLSQFGLLNINQELKEVHAMIGSDRVGRAKSTNFDYVLTQLESDYPNLFHVNRISAAWKSIYELYALGYTDEQIGGLVGSAVWDEKSQVFTILSKEVEDACRNKGVSTYDLVDLVKIDHLKTQIRIEKSRLISKLFIQKLIGDTN